MDILKMTEGTEIRQTDCNRIIKRLLEVMHKDPDTFEMLLPDLYYELSNKKTHGITTKSMGLTGKEIEQHKNYLYELLNQRDDQISKEQTIKGIEHCAALIEDGHLPLYVDKAVKMRLLRKIGITSVKNKTEIEISKGTVTKSISFIYGIKLNLSWDNQLLSIMMNPSKIRDRSAAFRIFITI